MQRGALRWAGGRRLASALLTVAGAALLLLGAILLYAREEVFDSDAFADHAAQSLRDERVRVALAERIVDKVIDRGPDELINARPLLTSAVIGGLDSRPFRFAFRQGIRKLHRVWFSRDRDELVLTITDPGDLVADAVRSVSPELAEKVPTDIGDRVTELTDSDVAIESVRIAEDVRLLGVLVPLAGLLCLAGAVAVAPDRRRALVGVSAAAAAAAAVGFVALLVGRSLVLDQFQDDAVHDAFAAAWDSFLGGLRTWFVGAGATAVLVAAAVSAARPLDLAEPVRRLARLARETPKSTAGRLARAGLALAAGLFVVLKPGLALEVAAVLVGLYLLFLALGELLLVVAPPPREPKPAARRGPFWRRASPRATAVAAIALAGAAAIVAALALGGGKEPPSRPAGPIEVCNGYPELCDRRVNDVAFPAAHNAMSAASDDFIAPNQKTGIREQLDRGVRALLIDAHYGIKRTRGPVLTDIERERTRRGKITETVAEQFGPGAAKRVGQIVQRFARRGGEGRPGTYLCHVVCELGAIELVKALTWVREFLDTHPDEFVVVFIEDYISPQDVKRAFEDSGLVRYAHVQPRDEPLPTLRELIRQDKRVLVLAENDSGEGSIRWYHDGFELSQETPFTFHSAEELDDYRISCEPNRGGTDGPLFLLNHWVEKLPRSPDLGAQVNSYELLLRRARRCKRRRELLPSLVAVDFYDQGDLFEVTTKLNGLPRTSEPSYRKTG